MRAGVVAARDEGCTLGLNGLQRKADVPCPIDAGGIALWSDDDKIVVHHGIALHAKPFRDEFLLRLPGMHQNHVGIAAARHVERLAGTQGDDFNVDAGPLLEQRKDEAVQPGILRRSGRGNYDGFILRRSERDLRKGKAKANHKREISHSGEPSLAQLEYSELV